MASAAAAPVKINLVYYSAYGHMKTLIDAAAKGIREAGGEANVFYAAETLPVEVLEKMHAAAKPFNADAKEVDRDTWHLADGFIFGVPTRFGTMSAQMKAFIDGTGQLWQSGALVGKAYGVFSSTATGGGQEATIYSTVTNLTHHGAVYVPLGYTHPIMFDTSRPHGLTPAGVTTIAGGKGEQNPLPEELEAAAAYGKRLVKVAGALRGI